MGPRKLSDKVYTTSAVAAPTTNFSFLSMVVTIQKDISEDLINMIVYAFYAYTVKKQQGEDSHPEDAVDG
jgi:glyceraldehyde-3-phosphate dehydrogenase/erythrose-4-phosphate dehydrogenase